MISTDNCPTGGLVPSHYLCTVLIWVREASTGRRANVKDFQKTPKPGYLNPSRGFSQRAEGNVDDLVIPRDLSR